MMTKFDYMNFGIDGQDTEFVANAEKYTREQAINLCVLGKENAWRFKPGYCNEKLLRMPTICDVKLRYAKKKRWLQRLSRVWYVKASEKCGYDDKKSCYSYCKAGERSSFPVWVIEFEKLEIKRNS